MNGDEVTAFYARCMAIRQWLKPLSQVELQAWAWLLEPVPAREEPFLLKELFGTPGKDYRFFEPKTVLEAWEAIKAERRRLVGIVHSADRQLAGDPPPEIAEELRSRRQRALAQLPQHVIDHAGFELEGYRPPPPVSRQLEDRRGPQKLFGG